MPVPRYIMPKRQPAQPIMDANACRAMATLLLSGLSPQQVFGMLGEQLPRNSGLASACMLAAAQVQQGQSFQQVLLQQPFFSRGQLLQVQIAEHSGKLPQLLMQFAHAMQQQYEHKQQLKVRLILSQAVIAVASVAGIVLALLKGESIWLTVLSLAAMLFLTRLLFWLLAVDKIYLLARIWQDNSWLNNIGLYKRFFEQQWYGLLVIQLEAGIDAAQAMKQLKEAFPSRALQRQAARCFSYLDKGCSMTAALSQSGLILSNDLKQLLLAGERSGRLAPMLRHYLHIEQRKLNVMVEGCYEWLPRFYYVVAVGVMLRVVV